jgi:D-alanyl-D-alanine carboxypeptidase
MLLAPELTMAPLHAGEPWIRPPLPLDAGDAWALPRIVPPPKVDRRTAGPVIPPATPDAASFQAALDAARASAGAYGITFAAVRDGEVVWTGSSGNGRDGQAPLLPDGEMVIGSVTKTYVAATILQLAEEGRLSLDDSVRKYLPERRGVSRAITIGQLMDHTSGLADLFNDTTRKGLEEHPEHAWSADEVLNALHAPWYEPGEGWAYANTNYYLLAMLVEAVTDAPLADELHARFLGPLNLGATSVLDGGQVGSPLDEAWTTIFWGSGAMGASAVDLARWGDALYAGDLLSRESRAAMLDFNADDYGLGVQRLEVDDIDGYGHTGLLNTYTTLLFHIPEEGVTIALLVNRSHVDLGGMLTAEPPDGPSLLELALGE